MDRSESADIDSERLKALFSNKNSKPQPEIQVEASDRMTNQHKIICRKIHRGAVNLENHRSQLIKNRSKVGFGYLWQAREIIRSSLIDGG